tara:strand:+ start:297 stop:527 length:231 start_codon:yes stop_codon:yes gene_type:complete
MSDNKEVLQTKGVVAHIKKVCEDEIATLEDRLPAVTDLLEKDQILKEIDALNQIADEANTRAEGIIKELEEIRRKG